ncbi:MAG: hypothetical protein IRZ33_04695 [Alicyclobacillaceae bacterium]|nr:hypothetical protein [Alicyclobacillaceae bacterium]
MELYVVWYSNGSGWRPSKPMSRQEAEQFAALLVANGYRTEVCPRHRVTRKDIVEG